MGHEDGWRPLQPEKKTYCHISSPGGWVRIAMTHSDRRRWGSRRYVFWTCACSWDPGGRESTMLTPCSKGTHLWIKPNSDSTPTPTPTRLCNQTAHHSAGSRDGDGKLLKHQVHMWQNTHFLLWHVIGTCQAFYWSSHFWTYNFQNPGSVCVGGAVLSLLFSFTSHFHFYLKSSEDAERHTEHKFPLPVHFPNAFLQQPVLGQI